MTELDERPDGGNLPAEVVHRTLEIPVAEFEGEYVRIMVGKLPQLNLEMESGYRRGTHLKLELEVRVQEISVRESKDRSTRGDLVREHVLALEEIKLLGAYTADELDPGTGGSASVGAQDDDEEPDERPETEQTEQGESRERDTSDDFVDF